MVLTLRALRYTLKHSGVVIPAGMPVDCMDAGGRTTQERLPDPVPGTVTRNRQVLDQREVLADGFTSLCLDSGIPAGTTVSRRHLSIPKSSYRQGCRYPVPGTVTRNRQVLDQREVPADGFTSLCLDSGIPAGTTVSRRHLSIPKSSYRQGCRYPVPGTVTRNRQVLDQREVPADGFTSLCLDSGIPAGTTVSRRHLSIPESSYRQGCRYPVPGTVTRNRQVLDQREVPADGFTSLCLGSGIPAGTTVSRRHLSIPESSYRQGCRYPAPWTDGNSE